MNIQVSESVYPFKYKQKNCNVQLRKHKSSIFKKTENLFDTVYIPLLYYQELMKEIS